MKIFELKKSMIEVSDKRFTRRLRARFGKSQPRLPADASSLFDNKAHNGAITAFEDPSLATDLGYRETIGIEGVVFTQPNKPRYFNSQQHINTPLDSDHDLFQ